MAMAMAGAQLALSSTPSPSSSTSSSFVAATMNESHLRSSCRRKLDISSSSSSHHAHSHLLLRPHEQSRSSSPSSSSSSSSSASLPLKKKILRNLPSSQFFFAWEARSHLGSSLRYPLDWKKICRRKSQRVVQASLFGVGAPEALVIGVVALLVFGPKGLAEVARTLGKSLRSFQPTLKELQQISRDFKDTLEQEIGLDELRESNPSQPVYKSNESVEQKAYSTNDYLRVTEDQARALVPEEQRKAAEAAAWGGTPPVATEQVQISSDVEIQTSEQTQVPAISNFETEQKTQTEVPPISKVETEDEVLPISKVETQDAVPPISKVEIEQDAQAEGASKVAN